MNEIKLKNSEELQQASDNTGKVVRISSKHREILNSARKEINSDPTYRKKISLTRYVEKLIEDHWNKPVEALKKEREGSEDWLRIEYKREAPNMDFFDWLRARIENGKKSNVKKNNSEKK